MSTCFTLTLGDNLVIIGYTQKPRENVEADIHVSSGDRGLNSTAIYHLHSYFTLTSLYHCTDFPESRVLVAGQCDKYQTLTYWLILIFIYYLFIQYFQRVALIKYKTCKGVCSEDILKTYNHPVCPSVRLSIEVYCNEN